jgi:hypothetical protein
MEDGQTEEGQFVEAPKAARKKSDIGFENFYNRQAETPSRPMSFVPSAMTGVVAAEDQEAGSKSMKAKKGKRS